MPILSQLLGQDAFPMLEKLRFIGSSGIGDSGVAILVQGLLAASRTRFNRLGLQKVGMGDKGIAAVASLIGAGRFKQLGWISLSNNVDFTDAGVGLLARAIEVAGKDGLPMLDKLYGREMSLVTGAGVGLLAHTLITHCPRLKLLDMSENDENASAHEAVVEAMELAARYKYRSLDFKV